MSIPKLPKPAKSKYTDFDRLPLMLNVNDVAELLRVSRANAYKIVNAKGFPRVTVGEKRVLVAKADLMRWLHNALGQAIRNGILVRNVAEAVTLPKKQPKERRMPHVNIHALRHPYVKQKLKKFLNYFSTA